MRYLLVLLLLTGCATAEQKQAQAIQSAKAECDRLGFAADTAEHRNCVMELYKTAKTNAAMTEAAASGAVVGASMNRIPKQQTCTAYNGVLTCR